MASHSRQKLIPASTANFTDEPVSLVVKFLFRVSSMATTEPGTTAACSLSAEQLSEVLRTVKDGMHEEMHVSKCKRELVGDK